MLNNVFKNNILSHIFPNIYQKQYFVLLVYI